jgi:hypothetical protein
MVYKYGTHGIKLETSYYKMLKKPGETKIRGYEHYALWLPVKKFLCFWIRRGEPFYLDMEGFEKI